MAAYIVGCATMLIVGFIGGWVQHILWIRDHGPHRP
jgi:hypothetical protein